jgi:hypothetical protein
MASTVKKCGNSLAVRIPNALAVATIVSGRIRGRDDSYAGFFGAVHALAMRPDIGQPLQPRIPIGGPTC